MQLASSRRTFVKSLAAGGAVAGLGLWQQPVWALTSPGQPTVLSGTEFDLTIDSMSVDFTGKRRTAMAINGSIPGPLLRWREGDTVTLRVRNRLPHDTSIHWHGILLPANMDGLPASASPASRRMACTNTASRSSRAAPTGTTATPVFRNSWASMAR